MNFEICKNCNQNCAIFFKKEKDGCFADILKLNDFDNEYRDYIRLNRTEGMLFGIKAMTSDAWVDRGGKAKLTRWEATVPSSSIADYENMKSVPVELVDKWEFEAYVPYDRCKDECPYWMEHKASSIASGEGE